MSHDNYPTSNTPVNTSDLGNNQGTVNHSHIPASPTSDQRALEVDQLYAELLSIRAEAEELQSQVLDRMDDPELNSADQACLESLSHSSRSMVTDSRAAVAASSTTAADSELLRSRLAVISQQFGPYELSASTRPWRSSHDNAEHTRALIRQIGADPDHVFSDDDEQEEDFYASQSRLKMRASQAVELLARRPARRQTRATAAEICCICHDETQSEGFVDLPRCGHGVHGECMSMWTQRSYQCPLCRRRVSLRSARALKARSTRRSMKRRQQQGDQQQSDSTSEEDEPAVPWT